jgi:Zn finger protein HypA/HybF involved in hydrogenase expression
MIEMSEYHCHDCDQEWTQSDNEMLECPCCLNTNAADITRLRCFSFQDEEYQSKKGWRE